MESLEPDCRGGAQHVGRCGCGCTRSSHQQAWQTEDDHGRSRHGVHFAWVQISTPAVFGKFGFLLSEGQVTLFQAPDATRPVAMRPLGINWFGNLLEARRLIEDWRQHYNERRPHSSLGYQTPAAFARQFPVAA
jgi:transposase InsO family protein